MIAFQNQLQRLRTEEDMRQRNSVKTCVEGEEEEEEEDESSNSTTSSPCLRHKDQQNSRYTPLNCGSLLLLLTKFRPALNYFIFKVIWTEMFLILGSSFAFLSSSSPEAIKSAFKATH